MDKSIFSEYVDCEMYQKLLEHFYPITGVPAAILDVDNRVIAAVGWQNICTQFHRANPITCQRCRESDSYIKENLRPNQPCAYKCKNGLWDVAVPILVENQHLATFFIGQFFKENEAIDVEFFIKQAREFGFDTSAYLDALQKVPVVSEAKIEQILQCFSAYVQMLSDQALVQMKLRRQIQERAKAELKLQTTIHFYDTLIDTIPNPIFYKDMQGVYIGCNQSFAQNIYGLPKEQVIGCSIDDLAQRDIIPSRLAEIYKLNDQKTFNGNTTNAYEAQARCSNGQIRDFFFYKTPFKDSNGNKAGLVGIMLDITEKNAIQHALEQSRKRYQRITEVMTDYIYTVHFEQGRPPYTTHTPNCANVTGYHANEFDQNAYLWIDMVHPDDRALVLNQAHLACSGVALEPFEHRIIHKNGQIRWVRNTIVQHYDGQGSLLFYDGLIRDITEQKLDEITIQQAKCHAEQSQKQTEQINQELQIAIEKANLMAQEALAANHAKSYFLASMSHEIRTPMNAIVGFSELLAQDQLSEQQKQFVTIVRDASHNLLTIINDILDFSKIESGKMKIDIVECSIESILAGIDSLLRPNASQKNLDFKIELHPDLPATIYTDPVRLRQCLINLISNAIKFTPQGSVHVHAFRASQENQPFIQFDIRDSGIGIEPDKIDQIFQSFSQADSSTTRRFGGTGLGLAITKNLIEILGGSITVDSQPHHGSTFSLLLPLRLSNDETKTNEQPALRETPLSNAPIEPFQTRRQILVAEDNPSNQQLMQTMLDKLNCQTFMVSNGLEALEYLAQQQFDLILLDMQMPKLNGCQTACEIRNRGITTPIIAVTAHALKEDRLNYLKAGCTDVIAKPIHIEQLKNIIEACSTASKPLQNAAL